MGECVNAGMRAEIRAVHLMIEMRRADLNSRVLSGGRGSVGGISERSQWGLEIQSAKLKIKNSGIKADSQLPNLLPDPINNPAR
jgi:hypothetical protein